jgi:hypothetical protein
MALDPMIARGVAPIDVSNTLAEVAALRQRDQSLQQDASANALMRERFQYGRQQDQAAAQRGEEDDAEWDAAYQAKDWGAMARIDPQTTKILWDQEQSAQPKAPEYRAVGDSLLELPTAPGGQPRVAFQAPPKPEKPEKGPDAPSGYRWNAEGGLEPIPGGPSDPSGPGARKNVQPLRKEFEGLDSVKSFKTSLPLLVSARKAPDNGYGDLQLIYTAGKILDPGSVVREGELALTVAAGSPLQRIIGQTRFSTENGGRLTPQTRKQILEMLNERVLAYRQAFDQDRERFGTYAEEAGGKREDVIGQHPANAFKNSGAASGPVKVKSVQDAAKLKPGTEFITPDGQHRVRK